MNKLLIPIVLAPLALFAGDRGSSNNNGDANAEVGAGASTKNATAAFIVPQGFHGDAATGPADVVGWWKKFNDPELQTLIERALQTGLDMKIAKARVAEARAVVAKAKAAPRPSVNENSNVFHSTGSPTNNHLSPTADQILGINPSSGGGTVDSRSTGLQAKWTRNLFGGDKNNILAAKKDFEAAEEDEKVTMVSLAADVATNYLQLRGYQEQIDWTQRTSDLQEDTLKLARARFSAGLIPDTDLPSMEAALTATQATIPQLQSGIEVAAHRLAVLTGQEPGALLNELLSTKPLPEGPPAIPAGLPSDVLRRRPDVREAEHKIEAAKARKAVATAQRYPSFSLFGSFGDHAQSLSSLSLLNVGKFFNISPSMSLPLFQGGRIKSEIQNQSARQEEAELLYQKAVLQALQEVEDALVSHQRETDRQRFLEQTVLNDQRKLDKAKELYTGGLQDYSPVQDAEEALLAAKTLLAESRRNLAVDTVSLYRALGGGWD